jgi:hypothetical protein
MATWVPRPPAPTATTVIIPTRARRMDTMGRAGSRAASSLAQGRGITAITARAMGTMGAAGTVTTDAAGMAITVAVTTGRAPTDPIEAAELVMLVAMQAPQRAAASTVAAGVDAVKRPTMNELKKRLTANAVSRFGLWEESLIAEQSDFG